MYLSNWTLSVLVQVPSYRVHSKDLNWVSLTTSKALFCHTPAWVDPTNRSTLGLRLLSLFWVSWYQEPYCLGSIFGSRHCWNSRGAPPQGSAIYTRWALQSRIGRSTFWILLPEVWVWGILNPGILHLGSYPKCPGVSLVIRVLDLLRRTLGAGVGPKHGANSATARQHSDSALHNIYIYVPRGSKYLTFRLSGPKYH